MLYLLRHADSTSSSDLPESDWPLSERGDAQAEALVHRLAGRQIDVLYVSPYRRAAATVRPLAEDRNLALRIDDRFRERELTDQWLDDHQAALRRVWNDFTLTLPGGESSADCQRRVVEAVGDLRAHYGTDERVLICSHGNAIALYLNHLDPGVGFAEWEALRNPDLIAVQEDQWTRMSLTMSIGT
jgi:2,3-bisphosphoglycerate-dependent phosphoglycerate mutase